MNRNTILFSVAAAATLLGAPAAFAEGRRMTIAAPTHAELTMAQAVVIAESMADGRATRVHREGDGARPVFRVTVQGRQQGPQKIDVAMADGQIVASERKSD